MTTNETAEITAKIILTTEQGEIPENKDLERLIADQMSGALDETTGLQCLAVTVTGRTGELEGDETVWVVVFEHKYGVDVAIGHTENDALDAVDAYTREWWEQDVGHGVPMPDNRDDRIATYFDQVDNEFYSIKETTIR